MKKYRGPAHGSPYPLSRLEGDMSWTRVDDQDFSKTI